MNRAFLTVDLGFGDAGKGSIVDYLVREHGAHTVVRYNGGAQAGHRVVDGDREHVFSQFGAGTLAGAATVLSRTMLVEPLAMQAEAAHLEQLGVADPFRQVMVDGEALMITPFQQAANRLKELARGDGRHGSCGMGIGETMADALRWSADAPRIGDLYQPDRLAAKLRLAQQRNCMKAMALFERIPYTATAFRELEVLQDKSWIEYLMAEYAAFARLIRIVGIDHIRHQVCDYGAVVFEGAQGVLLDEWRGFHPHTTWSTTTLANAEQLLADVAYRGEVTQIGITRAYGTRHGAGPFVTEDATLTDDLRDACNEFDTWQEGFRVGWLDGVLLRYAKAVVGRLDQIAVTCLDRVADRDAISVCDAYTWRGETIDDLPLSVNPHDLQHQAGLTRLLTEARPSYRHLSGEAELLQWIEAQCGAPVGICSYGPAASDKIVPEGSCLGLRIK